MSEFRPGPDDWALDSDLEAAGAEYRDADVPDSIDLAWLRDQADLLERGLFLTDDEELALEEVPPLNMRLAMKRWGYLKHLHHKRAAWRRPAKREEAMRGLLRREPVIVFVPGGRRVEVTSRGYATMFEIARHAVRLRELEDVIEELDADYARAPSHQSRRRVARFHRRAIFEARLQRQAIYAHAFTPDGRPASSLEDAPAWWTEIDALGDSLILNALFQAGHLRYAELGEPPRRRNEGRKLEDFGWHSLLAELAREESVPAAETYDRDFFQQLAELRAAAPPVFD